MLRSVRVPGATYQGTMSFGILLSRRMCEEFSLYMNMTAILIIGFLVLCLHFYAYNSTSFAPMITRAVQI